MAAIPEVAQKESSSPLYRVNIGAERRKKVLATGFINGERTALVLMEKPRSIEVFPGMIGSFKLPAGGIKYRKFIDFKPQR